MRRRITALILAAAMLLTLAPNILAQTTGTADGVYDFGELGSNDTAGTGYQKLGDKFKVENGVFNAEVSAKPSLEDPSKKTMIYKSTNGLEFSARILAEGGTTCKSFTFRDLGVSAYQSADGFASCTLVLKDSYGIDLLNVNLGASAASGIPSDDIINLSTLYGLSQWNVAGVSEVILTYTMASGREAQMLNFENISIANISAQHYYPALPVFSSHPVGVAANPGEPVVLSVGATATSGTLSYQWYSNSTNSNTGGTPITGATQSSYSFTASAIGTVYYYCVVTNTDPSTVAQTITATSSPAAVEINNLENAEAPVITAQPQDKFVKSGSSFSFGVAATVDSGTLTYQWYVNDTDSTSGGSPVAGATTANHSFTPTQVGTRYYYCVVTNTDNSVGGTKTATTVTRAAKVIATHADGVYDFAGSSSTYSSATTGFQTIGSLFMAPNGSFVPCDGVSGGDNTALYINNTTNTATATLYARGGTVCKTFAFHDLGFSAYQDEDLSFESLTIKLYRPNGNMLMSISPYNTPLQLPNDAVVNLSTLCGEEEWTVSNIAAIEISMVVSTTIENVQIENIKVSNVSVQAANAPVPIITVQPQSKTVLTDAEAPLSVIAGSSSGTLSYQWYSNSTNSTDGATLLTGETAFTLDAPTNTVGTTYYYCVITNTDPTATVTQTATATTNIVSVTVSEPVDAETPSITAQPQPKAVITNEAAQLTVEASVDSGTLSYQWYSNSTNSTDGATLLTDETAEAFDAPTDTVGTTYYYCVITNTDPAATGAQTVTATTDIVAVTVSAGVDAETPSITAQPQPKTVYLNQAAELTVEASVDSGTLSYQWYSNSTNSTTGASPLTGETSSTFDAVTDAVGTTYYYCVITNTDPAATGAQTVTATTDIVAVTVSVEQPSISPATANYDLNAPANVSTTCSLGSASTVVGVVCGANTLSEGTDYTLSGNTLTIAQSYIGSLGASLGDDLVFEVAFDVGSTVQFTVNIVDSYIPSSDSTLSALTVGGTSVAGFAPETTGYSITLPYGTEVGSPAATVAAIPNDANAQVEITQAAALPGNATVLVTAENGADMHTYTVNLLVAPPPIVSTLFITAGTGGRITAGANGNYEQNTGIAIAAQSNAGYRFDRWTSTNGGTFANAQSATTTFTMPPNDTEIKANFVPVSSSSGRDSDTTDTDDTSDTVSSRSITITARTVSVDLTQGATVISQTQLAELVEANKTKPVVFTASGYTVTFPAGSMSAGSGATNLNLALRMDGQSDRYAQIKPLAGDGFAMLLDFAHSGALPGTAVIRVYIGSQYAGKTLYYYYYNPVTGGFEYRQTVTADDGGYITVTQSRCSQYVLSTKQLTDELPAIPETGALPETLPSQNTALFYLPVKKEDEDEATEQ